MEKNTIVLIIFVIVMVGIIVAVDILFFRHHFWERLIANVGIVLLFIAFYSSFFRH